MKTTKGDLIRLALAGQFDLIIHGCNCFNTMGSGIAKSIRTTFPEAYRADQATTKGDRSKLGTFTSATVQRDGATITVVNGYTQYRYGSKTPDADYDAIRSVMRGVKSQFGNRRIGYPLIGAGLAQGDWPTIEKIINEELEGLDHSLVIYQV